MIQYRITIRDPERNWRSSIPANNEFEALKKALDQFRSESGYAPTADNIFIERDAEQFF